TDEAPGIKRALQILQLHAERLVLRQPFKEIIVLRSAFESARSGDTVFSYRFVGDLPITARPDGANDQLLGGHERQLGRKATLNHRRMHLEPPSNVCHQKEYGVGGEEHLRYHEATGGAVVERSIAV